MKKGQAKTRYFKKDYAPARIMAERKRSHSTTGKMTTNLKKTATKTSQTVKKVAKNLSKTNKTKTSSTKVHNKTTSRRKPVAKKLSWSEITLLSIIGTSAVAIVFSFAFTAIFDPVKRSERELSKLADAYYIEYLYPRALGGKFDEAEAILKDFTVQGLPNVRLRQLLLFDEAKYASSAEIFSNPYYKCDTNKTYVRYYPIEPYGPRDYIVQYGTACEKIGSLE